MVVAPGETINDDLYVFGGSLDVQGTVNGDVAFFGGTSTISGLITGDLMVMGGTTTINGIVSGSVPTRLEQAPHVLGHQQIVVGHYDSDGHGGRSLRPGLIGPGSDPGRAQDIGANSPLGR